MKKNIFIILFMFLCIFIFTNKVSAENKICTYRGGETSKGSIGIIRLEITNAKKSKAKVIEAGQVMGPNVVGPWYKAAKKIGNEKVDYSSKVKKDKIKKKLIYWDENEKTKTEKVPSLNSEGDCPTYVVAVINSIAQGSGGDYIQIFAGDDDLKDFISSFVAKNPAYNYMMYATKYKPYGEDVTDQDDNENVSQEEDYDTCEGLLGEKINNEYSEGTVGYLLQQIFDYMKFAAIILIFAFSVIDYAKAIAAQNADEFKKANINLLKRLVLGIVFFILPEIINIILSVIDSSTCGIN